MHVAGCRWAAATRLAAAAASSTSQHAHLTLQVVAMKIALIVLCQRFLITEVSAARAAIKAGFGPVCCHLARPYTGLRNFVFCCGEIAN